MIFDNSKSFDAILFDCDGVLVDSEPLTNGVLREMLGELGWQMSGAECFARFIGKAVKDEATTIEAHTGVRIDDVWLARFRARRDAQLLAHLQAVPHVEKALCAAHAATGGRIACASGADRGKVELQLNKVGLANWFAGQIYSGYEVPRTKPAPDVYLAAAAGLGADPKRCLVVEDSVVGATAGVAAGCRVLAYVPPHAAAGTAHSMREVGAIEHFSSMQALSALVASLA